MQIAAERFKRCHLREREESRLMKRVRSGRAWLLPIDGGLSRRIRSVNAKLIPRSFLSARVCDIARRLRRAWQHSRADPGSQARVTSRLRSAGTPWRSSRGYTVWAGVKGHPRTCINPRGRNKAARFFRDDAGKRNRRSASPLTPAIVGS